MMQEQKNRILSLRADGIPYNRIADSLGLSLSAVKSFHRRFKLAGQQGLSAKNTPTPANPAAITEGTDCKQCGRKLLHIPKRKPKKFCSDTCRFAYWASHRAGMKRKAFYPAICVNCGDSFEGYGNNGRKYCSHPCYITGRFDIVSKWEEFLRQKAAETAVSGERKDSKDKKQVHLVCGVINAGKGADHLHMIIEERLKMDAFCGDVYAFCGSYHDRIKYIRWDGSGFRLVNRRREHGTYFWPPAKLGATVAVSEQDFESLLAGTALV